MEQHVISEMEIIYRPNKLSTVPVTEQNAIKEQFRNHWNPNTIEFYEEFKVMIFNNANQTLGIVTLSKGGYAGTIVDLRYMFGVILKSGGTAFATCHNHPSGKLTSSSADDAMAKKINEGSELLDLKCLDHFIITASDCITY
jgi:DNA repair protein RadC